LQVHYIVGHDFVRVHRFGELVALTDGVTAADIYQALLGSLEDTLGLTSEDIASKMVAFESDGAAVMQV
jgi:hypothetical protein